MLDLLQKEVNTNENYRESLLSLLVNEITSKEISILQVANYDIGVITLNDGDNEWIKRLCLASLHTNEEQAFLNANSSFTFDFEYVQSQIIRTYLLLCRITYQHIIQKYQFYTLPQSDNLITIDNEIFGVRFSDEDLQNEYAYLRTISLDNLYHSYTLLKQIAVTLKTYPDSTAISTKSLFSFVQSTDSDSNLLEQMQQYRIKDFPLRHYNHVIELYAQSMNELEHLFTDVQPLLRIPIDPQLNIELIEQLNKNIVHANYENDIDKIQQMIQTITQFLNDLKNYVDFMLQRSSQEFVETCVYLAIENPILEWIPEGIRCENYVPLNIQLVQIRSTLQEQKVNIEERTIVLWQEEPDHSESPVRSLSSSSSSSEKTEESLAYPSLFKLDMKLVSFSTSSLFQELYQYRVESVPVSKPVKFKIIHPDGNIASLMCKVEKFQERLKKIFVDHQYNYDQYVVVDQNQIFIDMIKKEICPSQIVSNEYRIVEEKDLVCVEFQFNSTVVEYLTTSTNCISAVIKHFINVNCTNEMYLHFFDQYGVCIESKQKIDERLTIIVKERSTPSNTLCEINIERNDQQMIFLFDSETTWQQIECWLKTRSTDDYAFYSLKQQMILEKNQSISSTIDSNQSNSIAIDVISQQMITTVILSYENNAQTLQVFKTMKISTLLNFVDMKLENYTMILEKSDNSVTLSETDMEQLIDTYCTTENELLRFRLFVPSYIKIYNDEDEISISLQTKNITIREMLQLIGKPKNDHQYLALKQTKRVLNDDEIVSNLCSNEFLLVDKKDICHVHVNTDVRFVNHAIIADICKELQINVDNQYLLYSDEIIPSLATPLIYFQSNISIHFTITETSLPVAVTINDNQQQKTLEFLCDSSITVERLCSISCCLLGVINTTAELVLTDGTMIDKEMSLVDIDDSMTKIEFQLNSSPCRLLCSLTYSDRTIILPCQPDQLISSLVNKMFGQLSISSDQMDMHNLYALDDAQTEIDFDISIDDIKELFSSSSSSLQCATMHIEIRKK